MRYSLCLWRLIYPQPSLSQKLHCPKASNAQGCEHVAVNKDSKNEWVNLYVSCRSSCQIGEVLMVHMNLEKTIRKWPEQKEKYASESCPASFVISPRFVISSWRFPAILLSFLTVVTSTETTLIFYNLRNRHLQGSEGIIATGVSSGAVEGFRVLMILNVDFRIWYPKRIDYF